LTPLGRLLVAASIHWPSCATSFNMFQTVQGV
jgi:hypothetical protein